MVWVLMAILSVIWLFSLAFEIAGPFANVPLVIVAVLLTLELAKRMRAPA